MCRAFDRYNEFSKHLIKPPSKSEPGDITMFQSSFKGVNMINFAHA